MNDVKVLLERALDDVPPAGVEMDPSADLSRGRSRLRQRRTFTVAGVAAVALGVAVLPVALNNSAAPSLQSKPVAPASSAPQQSGPLSLALVAYTGKQIPGYKVASTPKGWVIQGGDPAVLTIAPKDAKSKDYTDFRNKLVVMLQSKDAAPPTEGTALEVAGRPGFLTVQDDVQMLTYQGEGDRWLVIQAPTSLGWDGKQIAEFATGVEVLGNAEAGLG